MNVILSRPAVHRATFCLGALAALTVMLSARPASADQTLVLTGQLAEGAPFFAQVEFEVPAGFQEIQVEHDDMDPDDILDWGLTSPAGFRGWGGGNEEPIVVNAQAASRSYLPSAIEAGTWRVDVGKAKIIGGSANYQITVTLRDVATLAPQSERSLYAAPPALESAARWYAGDLHVHSLESGDARASFDEIIALAKSRGLDFVELSDHNTTSQLDFMNAAQTRSNGLLLLPGVEFTTYAGHANGIGATQYVDHKFDPSAAGITVAADAFRTQGALFSINHPAFDLGDACIGCAWTQQLPADRVDAIEIATAGSAPLFYDATVVLWEQLAASGRHVAAVGGSDDHRAGEDPGAFGTPIGSPTTLVFAAELSVAGLLAGIKEGRTVVKLRGPEDPMVELGAESASETGLRARVSGRITAGAGKLARFVVDGVAGEFSDIDSDDFLLTTDAVGEPGQEHRYRVEVYDGATPVTATSHLWFTSEKPIASDVIPAGGSCTAAPGRTESYGAAAALCALLCGLGLRRRRPRRD